MNPDKFWEFESGFWEKGGKPYYRKHMHEKAIFVFEDGVGILTAKDVMGAIPESGSDWRNVALSNKQFEDHDGFVVMAYAARAGKADGSSYRANCSSTYVERDQTWSLTSHQQTPIED